MTTTSFPALLSTDVPPPCTATQSATPNASEPVRLITTVAAGLIRSADPAAVFGSLATAYARHTATRCTIELLTGSTVCLIQTPAAPTAPAPEAAVSEQTTLSVVARQLLAGDGAPLWGPDWFAVPIGAAEVRATGAETPVGSFTCRFPGRRADHGQLAPAQYLLSLATEVLQAERLLAKAQSQVANLEIALKSNRDIGTALGILMNAHLVTQEQAFLMLREVSQHSHRKLRDVANEVIFTGVLSARPPLPRG
jgi:hypothetical protein